MTIDAIALKGSTVGLCDLIVQSASAWGIEFFFFNVARFPSFFRCGTTKSRFQLRRLGHKVFRYSKLDAAYMPRFKRKVIQDSMTGKKPVTLVSDALLVLSHLAFCLFHTSR